MDYADHSIDRAARAIGGRRRLADLLRVSPAAIGNWKTRGVPIEHCAEIERLSAGAVTRQELRPLDWQRIWPELIARAPLTAVSTRVDRTTTDQTELFANGDGEGAAGHDATLTAAAPAVHHHAGVGR